MRSWVKGFDAGIEARKRREKLDNQTSTIYIQFPYRPPPPNPIFRPQWYFTVFWGESQSY